MMDFILNNATLIGLLFFFSFFLLMLMWVLHPGNRSAVARNIAENARPAQTKAEKEHRKDREAGFRRGHILEGERRDRVCIVGCDLHK